MASQRPISPHIQVYRWQVQMVTSILHRASGIVLALGSLLFVWGLVALAAGPAQWFDFSDCIRSVPGFVILFGWSWALAYHLVNGIRHLIQDAGWAFQIKDFVRNSWTTIIVSLVVTALIWFAAMQQWGAA
ncbi:succinate dehydrogenase [Lysobacter concretionis Ko07 = DSM 16239]|jgi:succinate dehydrogenase / fumarate reductase cytochrome b subunit|uniref:Succinate dehydrogenase cytochrome b556 subunit n=1 Tax=Lysobacter concretionis Ko07 = DSM 16239 TaxID=1122185 RepID=A0A0A0EPG8_9GAMM|nr:MULTISPECIES: succinate dehydrogenase, cytochrome b556 subunit [Lysobacter]KGM52033.1 succinate dehydrogenase [Lysobacter concretionis Ko07 = DSM 16239]QOD90231.1 succinate dehydrogenase, cytochrome b556 subunit [Lysobacter sp. CW239]